MYEKVVRDIVEFRITGAENITKWAVHAFSYKKEELDQTCKFMSTYLANLTKAKKELLSARKNEFGLANALDFIFNKSEYNSAKHISEIKKDITKKISKIEKHIEESHLRIASIGEKKIKKGMTILSLGHSSFVAEIISRAAEKTAFRTIILQSGPEEKGKDSITDIHTKTPITYAADTLSAEMLHEADIVFLGATGIDKNGLCVTEAGAKNIALLAKQCNIPVYIVTDSIKLGKLDIDDEERPKEELWVKPPRHVSIANSSFSILTKNEYTGIISELGIESFDQFVKSAKTAFWKY